jgi:DNA-binding NtrC family response regulator
MLRATARSCARRVVAATHQPLEKMADKRQFRRDLLARLAGFTLDLPP